jgi:brefeldin A-inhibited guanine nucleotide-exchange protein
MLSSQEAAPLFNAKPRQGIAFLMRTQKIRTPEDVARFLLKGQDLNRNLIGEYLGDRTPRCDQILRAYLHLFDFTGLEIDDALQAFLEKGLVLPTLPHKKRRILRRFGERYLEGNPGVEMSVNAAKDLAMSLVELRTILDLELGYGQVRAWTPVLYE